MTVTRFTLIPCGDVERDYNTGVMDVRSPYGQALGLSGRRDLAGVRTVRVIDASGFGPVHYCFHYGLPPAGPGYRIHAGCLEGRALVLVGYHRRAEFGGSWGPFLVRRLFPRRPA